MSRSATLAAAFVSLVAAPANAVVITYDHGHDGSGVPVTQVAGARINDFNSASFTSWTNGLNPVIGTIATGGAAQFVTGDRSGRYAAPFVSNGPIAGTDDPTVYLSVPSASSSGSITLLLDTTFDYFGLLWGSIDSYNTIAFLLNGVTVASFTGSDVTSPNAANGNQTAPGTNTYVNFFELPSFDAVRLASNGYAFELDNIALATLTCTVNCGGTGTSLPEPAALGLFALGVGGLGVAVRRRRAG